jgi:hypothetical protein
MRARVSKSLTRKIDLYIEFVRLVNYSVLKNKALFGKKPHSEKLHKFQPSQDLWRLHGA